MRIIILLLTISFFGCNNKKTSEKEEGATSDQVEQITEQESTGNDIPSTWDNPEIIKLAVNGYFPQFVPNRDAIIYSTKNYQGLWILDLSTEQVKQLSDKKGAGYLPVVFENKIIYQVKSRLSYLEQVNISTGEIQKVEKKYSRYAPKEYANVLNEQEVYVAPSDDLLSIEIKVGSAEIKKITPNGIKNYISVEISPSQSEILYKVAGLGAFISNLEGDQNHSLGDVDKPSWITENQIVYAFSKDDGMETLSSEVYVYDLNEEKKYNISQSIEEQVENPKSNNRGDMLIMNTSIGIIYLIKNKML